MSCRVFFEHEFGTEPERLTCTHLINEKAVAMQR
jgi:hypothetical protein